MKNPALWERLVAFDFDDCGNGEPIALPFHRRLARENGWEVDFAQRVVEEYRRFLYLACAAGHPITPSDEVDQAWHLHLTYSRSYWENLCPKVLEMPLHHEPTRGGKAEGAKFENWYEKTKESYLAAFGEEPPKEIWPSSQVRFQNAARFRRVNTQAVWMLPKPKPFRARRLNFNRESLKLAPVLATAIVLAGCAAVQSDLQSEGINVFNWHGEGFLAFFWAAFAVAITFSLWMRSQARMPRDAVFPIDQLDAYEIARLKDGNNLATDVAIASLYEKRAIDLTPDNQLQQTATTVPLTGFERSVWDKIGSGSTVLALRRGMAGEVDNIDRKLRSLGLLLDSGAARAINGWPLAVSFAFIGIGAIKIAVGLSRERPVGFLALSCFFVLLILIAIFSKSVRRSKRGDLFLNNLRRQYASLNRNSLANQADLYPIYFAIIGVAAFPAPIQSAMRPPSSSSSDGGGSGCSSSSDGGGGDGGGGCGGGGCGGCGGGGD